MQKSIKSIAASTSKQSHYSFCLGLFLLSAMALFAPSKALAQLFTDAGSMVHLNTGALLHVNGDVEVNGGGFFENNGTIQLTGNWTNNSGNTGFVPGLPGIVRLLGGPQQIGGTSSTLFYDLDLAGTGIKSTVVNTRNEGVLSLNNHELALNTFRFTVQNTALTAITRTTGFVSCVPGSTAALTRATDQTAAYLFPIGSSIGTSRYRPVEIKPTSTSANQFDAGLMNVSPTGAGYSENAIDTSVCMVNNAFYYILGHGLGSDVPTITIYYDTLVDGAYNAAAHWSGLNNLWTGTGNNVSIINPAPAFCSVAMSGWSDFNPKPFTLAHRRPLVELVSLPGYCKNDTAIIHATPGFNSYDWYLNGTLVHSGPDSLYAVNGLAANSSMQVVGHKIVACDGYSSTIPLLVYPGGGVSAGPDVSMLFGDGVELIASGGTNYQWYPPLGLSCDTCSSTMANPTASQGYTVTTYDSHNCRLIDSVLVTVNFNSSVYIPNIFSPNGDGVNDVLFVMGHGIRTMELVVFDRWGEKVFETTDQSQGWDGTFRGQLLNPAVFVYQFTAELDDVVQPVVSKGNITIVR